MKKIAILNGHILTPLEERFTALVLNGQYIERFGLEREPKDDYQYIDAQDCYVTPGLFDLQVNGGPECNLWANLEEKNLSKLQTALSKTGTSSFLPTLITDDLKQIQKYLSFLGTAIASSRQSLKAQFQAPSTINGSTRMPGVHLEGPFISAQRVGAHPPQWIQPLVPEIVSQLINSSVSLITLAPELDPKGQVIKSLIASGIKVSLGHSNATFEEAEFAFNCGVTLMTHTFNALPPIHHRKPGAVAAALMDKRVFCCLIADGLHLDPEIIRFILCIKGIDKSILVTDRAYVGTSQGGLVGSSITLDQAIRNIVKWKVATFADAIRMSTWNPASAMALNDHLGHLSEGKLADIVIWNKESLSIKHVIIDGQVIF